MASRPRPSPRTNRTRLVPAPVQTGHASSLPPYKPDTPRPCNGPRGPISRSGDVRGARAAGAEPRAGRAARRACHAQDPGRRAGLVVPAAPLPNRKWLGPTESVGDQPKVVGTVPHTRPPAVALPSTVIDPARAQARLRGAWEGSSVIHLGRPYPLLLTLLCGLPRSLLAFLLGLMTVFQIPAVVTIRVFLYETPEFHMKRRRR